MAACCTGMSDAKPCLTPSVCLTQCCINTRASLAQVSIWSTHLESHIHVLASGISWALPQSKSSHTAGWCLVAVRDKGRLSWNDGFSWCWFWKRLVVDGSTSDSTGWNLSWSSRTCLFWISLEYKIQTECMELESFYSFLPNNQSQLHGLLTSKYSLLCLHCLQLKSKQGSVLDPAGLLILTQKAVHQSCHRSHSPAQEMLLPPEEWSLDTWNLNKNLQVSADLKFWTNMEKNKEYFLVKSACCHLKFYTCILEIHYAGLCTKHYLAKRKIFVLNAVWSHTTATAFSTKWHKLHLQ